MYVHVLLLLHSTTTTCMYMYYYTYNTTTLLSVVSSSSLGSVVSTRPLLVSFLSLFAPKALLWKRCVITITLFPGRRLLW